MALETGTYITDLVSTNPLGTDTLDKADDHLRLIKSTLQATFPSVVGPTRATASGGAVTPGLQLVGLTDANSAQGVYRYSADTNPPRIVLSKSRGATAGTHTVVTSGDNLGYLSFTGSDGTAFIEAARIEADSDGTPGTNDMPGRLIFSTTADGASTPTERVRIDNKGDMTVTGTVSMGGSFLRNRIINGDMRFDIRNGGTSVTPTVTGTYTLDRWFANLSVTSKYSVQQQTSIVPAGFTHALKVTSLSAYSVLTGDQFALLQGIEGFNFGDMGFGTANAKSITLSFWVYSSLTGTFGGSFQNGAANRSYPFTYSIASANTWTQISITIPGDTTGTWTTDNTAGAYLSFGLGVGTTLSGTANTWAAANYRSATGAVSVVGTNAATWYVTGVQLEAGTVATPFERRLAGQELALCQRYAVYCSNMMVPGQIYSTSAGLFIYNTPVPMRSTPVLSTTAGYTALTAGGGNAGGTPAITSYYGNTLRIDTTGSTGLVAGNASVLFFPANSYLSSEL